MSYGSEKKLFWYLPNTRMNFSTKNADCHKSPDTPTRAKTVSELALFSISIQQNVFMHMYFYFKTSQRISFFPWRKDKKHIIAVNHIVNGANMH